MRRRSLQGASPASSIPSSDERETRTRRSCVASSRRYSKSSGPRPWTSWSRTISPGTDPTAAKATSSTCATRPTRMGAALSDIHFMIDDEIAEGDRVAVRLTANCDGPRRLPRHSRCQRPELLDRRDPHLPAARRQGRRTLASVRRLGPAANCAVRRQTRGQADVYQPAHGRFVVADPAALLAEMSAGSPATLVTNTAEGFWTSILPMLFSPDDGPAGILRGHLARGNPQWRADRSRDAGNRHLDRSGRLRFAGLVRGEAADRQGRADMELHHGCRPRHAVDTGGTRVAGRPRPAPGRAPRGRATRAVVGRRRAGRLRRDAGAGDRRPRAAHRSYRGEAQAEPEPQRRGHRRRDRRVGRWLSRRAGGQRADGAPRPPAPGRSVSSPAPAGR